MLKINTILSRAQQLPGEGAEIYSPINNGELIGLHSAFYWNYTDIVTYHQIVADRLKNLYMELEKAYEELKVKREKIDLENMDGDEAEIHNYQFSRALSGLRGRELELDSSSAFLKNYYIIGLWAMVEQYVGKTLTIGERNINGSSSAGSHVWSDIVDRFSKIGINVKACKGYSNIDECRVLNNKIKHIGVADEKLAEYPYFRNFSGQDLNRINFELQRYTDSVFEFVGNVMEELDLKIKRTDYHLPFS